MDGTVVRLTDKNFGFIRDTQGKEYFFHASSLKNIKFEHLTVGQEVTFEDNEGTKGPRADDIYV